MCKREIEFLQEDKKNSGRGKAMDISQLRYFKEAAENENITKAAKKLSTTQPALSKTIGKLETELGVKLFDRVGKNIILNEKGRIVLDYTKKILGRMEDISAEFNDMTLQLPSQVKVCMNAATKLMPQLILGFKCQYPHIKIVILQENALEKDISNCDVYIDSSNYKETSENCCVLLKEECFIGLPVEHPLAQKESITLEEVSEESFLILQNKRPLSEITNKFCEKAGFTPNITLECDNHDTIFSFIQIGMGIAFVPKLTWNAQGNEGISLVKVKDQHCYRFINLYWNKNRYLSKGAKLFMDYAINYFKNLKSNDDI